VFVLPRTLAKSEEFVRSCLPRSPRSRNSPSSFSLTLSSSTPRVPPSLTADELCTLPRASLPVDERDALLHASLPANVGDIPNGYTSDVVLNQQARVAHQGGMVDCLPGGPVAGDTMAVLDAGAYGGSGDRPMAGWLVVHA
jgi:hypothetical protein